MANVYNISNSVPYWDLLKGLSNDVKIALIAKLSDSILSSATQEKSQAKTLGDFYGCMKDDADFPSIKEIKSVMEDNDKDIERLLV